MCAVLQPATNSTVRPPQRGNECLGEGELGIHGICQNTTFVVATYNSAVDVSLSGLIVACMTEWPGGQGAARRHGGRPRRLSPLPGNLPDGAARLQQRAFRAVYFCWIC